MTRRPGSPAATVRALPSALAADLWGLAVTLADLTPPGVRYGYVHPVARRLLTRPLPALGEFPARLRAADGTTGAGGTDLRLGLVADHLDVGGIGRVVEMLAEGLRGEGVEPVVVCPSDGTRSARLRTLGHEVVVAGDEDWATRALRSAGLDVVQVHSAPAHLLGPALAAGVPVVPVLHNTEIHYDAPKWRETADLFDRATAVIAVSEIVRRFHQERVPTPAGDKIIVVPNGAMPMPAATPEVRAEARRQLSGLVNAPLDGEVVFACLARYDSQKNIAGTVRRSSTRWTDRPVPSAWSPRATRRTGSSCGAPRPSAAATATVTGSICSATPTRPPCSRLPTLSCSTRSSRAGRWRPPRRSRPACRSW